MACKGFEYLASPYTHSDPLVREQRYLRTLEATSILLKNGIWVYSPIVHCHHMSQVFGLPYDAAFWAAYNEEMLRASAGVLVLRLEGWHISVGVKEEIQLAIRINKPLNYLSGDLNAEAPTLFNRRSPE